MRFLFTRLLLEPKGGDGGNTTGNDNGGKSDEGAGKAPDLSKAAEGLISKHGDSTAALKVLLGENYELRDKVRQIGSKVPGEGSVVLTGDDVANYQSLVKLGKAEEIASALENGRMAVEKLTRVEREKVLGEAARAVGYDPDVLATLAGDLTIEVKDGKHLGKDVKLAEVVTRTKDEKGAEVVTRTPLDKHAEKEWVKFLPSLKGARVPVAGGSPPGSGGQPRPEITAQQARRSMVR